MCVIYLFVVVNVEVVVPAEVVTAVVHGIDAAASWIVDHIAVDLIS